MAAPGHGPRQPNGTGNRDGREHRGSSPRKRGAKPKGEQGGKDWPLLPAKDWDERTRAAHARPQPVCLPEPVTLRPGEGAGCAKAPKCQKRWKNCPVCKLSGLGSREPHPAWGTCAGVPQGARPRSQSCLCPICWSLTHSFISSFHFLFIYFVFTLSSLGAPP